MASTLITLRFSTCVDDSSRWEPENLAEANKDTNCLGYDEWVQNKLWEVMEKAGMEFIKLHPDLFCANATIT